MLIFPIIIDVNSVPYKSLNLIIFDRVVKPHFVKTNTETFHIRLVHTVKKTAAEAFVTAAVKQLYKGLCNRFV